MNTGFFVTALTARVTSAADSGQVPKLMPPPWTLGQLMLTSSISTCSSLSMRSQHSTYSSSEKPLMLAIMGFLKHFLSFGSSSAMTLSMPGFCRPTLLSSPEAHSAMRGVGLPKRGSRVVPFMDMLPRQLIS